MNGSFAHFPAMSIAVSSVLKPSRLLRTAAGSMCLGIALAGCIFGFGQAGNSLILSRVGIAAVCICLALLGFYRLVRNGNVHRIDVSGTGQIRLTEYRAPGPGSAAADRAPRPNSEAVVRLMADSTLWPNLLLLRLQAEDGRISVVPILPDSVGANDFRALSVAFRWIALREPSGDSKIS